MQHGSPAPRRELRAMVRLVHVMTVPESLGFLRGQVQFIKQRGFDISVITSPGEDLDAFGEREGVEVFAIAMPRRITPLRDLLTLLRIARVLRRIKPHIVHAHTPKGGLLGTLGAWLAGVPIRIYHIRGLPFLTATGRKRTLLRWTEWISCRFSHRVLSVSHSIRAVAIAERLCHAGKIAVLLGGSGNGVDSAERFNPERLLPDQGERTRDRLGIPRTARVVGFVGRLVRDKGVVELVHAWQNLRDEFPDLHLLLVGPFEPQDPVPDAIRSALESDLRVHLVGMDRDTPQFFAAMDLLVLPTYREGFPNVVLEASSMSLPVVATRIPGCVDAVEEGVTGTLVSAQDATALAAAIRHYLLDEGLRLRHGAAGRARVLREFDQRALWNALYEEYVRLLDRSRVPLAGRTA